MNPNPLAMVTAALLAVAATPARAGSLFCPGGFVQPGDRKLDLLAKCGLPTLVEESSREKGTFDVRSGVARRVVSPVAVWSYDLGKSQLVQRVRIERGRIVAIESGGWGRAAAPPSRPPPPKATCSPIDLGEGALSIEIVARCGDPAVRDEWQEEVASARTVEGQVIYADVVSRTIAVWTYDFGPNQLVRFVRIEDGKATRVESGSWGYGE